MPNFIQNLPHMIMGVVVIAAATILASAHIITGGEAIALIGPAGGFTLAAGSLSAMSPTTSQTVPVNASSNSPASTTATQPALAAVADPQQQV